LPEQQGFSPPGMGNKKASAFADALGG